LTSRSAYLYFTHRLSVNISTPLQNVGNMTFKVMAFGLQRGENSCQPFAATPRFHTSPDRKRSRYLRCPDVAQV
jgi:hypothetical protein